MAILVQNENSEMFYIGWFGDCDSDCQDINLSTSDFRDKISKIFQIRSDNKGYRGFDGSISVNYDNFLQHFTTLECGKSYLIILKKGNGEVNLPGFIGTHIDSEDSGRITKNCSAPTPTPGNTSNQQTDATPTPGSFQGASSTTPDPFWINFSATDASGENHFTSWHKLNKIESQPVTNVDVTSAVSAWNDTIVAELGGEEIKDGTVFDRTKHSVTHISGKYTALTGIKPDTAEFGYTNTNEMLDALDKKLTFKEIDEFFGSVWKVNGERPADHTTFVPESGEMILMDTEVFKGNNLLNIAMIQVQNTDGFVDSTKIFGDGEIDLSCKECGASLPRLVLVDTNNNKYFYTDRIYKASGCDGSNQLSTTSSSRWYKAPVVYNCINAPLNTITIKELYFDIADGDKLKLSEFKC